MHSICTVVVRGEAPGEYAPGSNLNVSERLPAAPLVRRLPKFARW